MLRIAAEKCRFIPARSVTDNPSILTLKNLVLEPLTRWEDGTIRPGLFSSWSHDGSGRDWRFTIRPGATFHDGQPCTAEDIVHYIEQICTSIDQFGMKWAYSRYLAQARITAVARDTVALQHPTPFGDILDIFSEFYICRDDEAGRPVLGTGRYRVTDLVQEQHVLLERVAPGEGPQRIRLDAIPLAEDRLRALRAGEVDAAMTLEAVTAPLDFGPDLQWGRALNTMSVMYYLNQFEGLFSNPAARLAINHAVDSDAIIRDLFHSLGQRSSNIVSPYHLGMHDAASTPFPYDPDKAKRLLEVCNVPGKLLIRTPTYLPEKSREISAAVAGYLSAIGLESKIEVQEDRPEFAREVGRKHIGDLAIFDSTPHATYRVLNDKVSSVTKGLWWQGHDDAELESLILKANQAVADADREAAYGRCLARLRQDPPWLYLFHPVEVFATAKGISGLALDSKGVLTIP